MITTVGSVVVVVVFRTQEIACKRIKTTKRRCVSVVTEGDRRSSEGRVDVGIIRCRYYPMLVLSNGDKEDEDKEDDDKENDDIEDEKLVRVQVQLCWGLRKKLNLPFVTKT